MYTISKAPSKLVAKTRRGISQSYEKIETMRANSSKSCEEIIRIPTPVFQTTKKNIAEQMYKTMNNTNNNESISPQHEELIKYIYDSWNIIAAQNPYDVSSSCAESITVWSYAQIVWSYSQMPYKTASPTSSISSSSSSIYYADPPSPVLRNFEPFDLESWWGRRLFNNITKSL